MKSLISRKKHMAGKAVWHFSCLVLLLFSLYGPLVATSEANSRKPKYKTKYVIVIVVDGPRYSETWGDSLHKFIPYMANEIGKSGVIFSNFYNDGYTYTSSGHAAIC